MGSKSFVRPSSQQSVGPPRWFAGRCGRSGSALPAGRRCRVRRCDHWSARPTPRRPLGAYRAERSRSDLRDHGRADARRLVGTCVSDPRRSRTAPHQGTAADRSLDATGRHQPGDHPNRVPTRRGVHHHSPTPLHDRFLVPATATAYDPLQLPSLLNSQTTSPNRFRHHTLP